MAQEKCQNALSISSDSRLLLLIIIIIVIEGQLKGTVEYYTHLYSVFCELSFIIINVERVSNLDLVFKIH